MLQAEVKISACFRCKACDKKVQWTFFHYRTDPQSLFGIFFQIKKGMG